MRTSERLVNLALMFVPSGVYTAEIFVLSSSGMVPTHSVSFDVTS